MMTRATLTLGVFCALLVPPAAAQSVSPDALKIKPVVLEATSVSGISSGAYMAVQFAVVNADYVTGLGAEAGGPFFCAGDGLSLYRTTQKIPGSSGECMENGTPDISRSLHKAKATLSQGELEKLKAQKVWLFSGSNDRTVDRKVVDKLEEFLGAMGVRDITYVKGAAAHGHLLDLPGGSPAACTDQATVKSAEYFADCDTDAARLMLEKAYGAPASSKTTANPSRLHAFSQEAPWQARMADTGHVYVPEICEKETCRVHVAFHGCHQGEEIGDHFATRSGYSEWAEAFRAVILYPRIRKGDQINPNGCWDWWGYTDITYNPMMLSVWSDGSYATKAAPQIQAVDAMLRRLAKPGS